MDPQVMDPQETIDQGASTSTQEVILHAKQSIGPPPSYDDFPPAYSADNDELGDDCPGYSIRRHSLPGGRRQMRVYTVMSRGGYSMASSRFRNPSIRERSTVERLRLLIGTFFVLLLGVIILTLTLVLTFSLA